MAAKKLVAKEKESVLKSIPVDVLRDMYYMLVKIRREGERVAELYPENEMRCPIHLSIGQEAIAVGVCANLRKDDYVFSFHRCHAHYLAKGGDLNRLIAELYGKSTGCARGVGGSMHLVAPEVGFMGASSILAGAIPIAMGTALATVMQGLDRVSVAFFGDAGVEEGTFHESLNFAALKSLPIIFVCENNLYAIYSHLLARQPADNIFERGESHHVPGLCVDGNDLLAVYQAAKEAVDRCRRGQGPFLIECKTYRWMEHVGPNYNYELGHHSKEELEKWMARCPVGMHKKLLLENGILSQKDVDSIAEKVNAEVEEAVKFAKESPFPDEAELLEDVY
ncbi:MAG: thiamine pyrophosphate-dependent dehydrogenase E1 component subunit alpha [Candidatus Brocadiaceae bacterium]|nr:thiamine pyrophosphate-dependent dehydrogenase E1 component subunit alpha [Candidatus Brocadiaceae bacterium]